MNIQNISDSLIYDPFRVRVVVLSAFVMICNPFGIGALMNERAYRFIKMNDDVGSDA